MVERYSQLCQKVQRWIRLDITRVLDFIGKEKKDNHNDCKCAFKQQRQDRCGVQTRCTNFTHLGRLENQDACGWEQK